MNVAMMSFSDGGGGAYNAAFRLMEAINQMDAVNCDMIVQKRGTQCPDVLPILSYDPFLRYIQETRFSGNVSEGHVLMSFMYAGAEVGYLEMLRPYDIVHFHWIANFVSAESISYLRNMGKSLVWTLHDLNPMTGGCHYSYGCEKYTVDCDLCPEMKENPYNITKELLEQKVRYIPNEVVVVSPSQWLADCARKSRVFCKNRIEVIPNSINLELFQAHDKKRAKKKIGLSENQKAILYCAISLRLINKGYLYFLEMLKYAKGNGLWDEKEVTIVLVGNDSIQVARDLRALEISVLPMGGIQDDELLSMVYSAADVTVLPSIEDNLPNVMLESLACGTPLAAFATGGIVDVVKDGQNGYVVPPKDSIALGHAVKKILLEGNMSGRCRRFAEEKFGHEIQAKRYKDLYDDIFSQRKNNEQLPPFVMPTRAHRILGPFYHEAMQNVLRMDSKELERFLRLQSLEEAVIEYTLRHLNWFEKYGKQSIAIWGMGDFAKQLLDSICRHDATFGRKIKGYFDKESSVSVKYGWPRLEKNWKEISQLSAIIIGSLKYEDEIYEELKVWEDKCVTVIRLRRLYENCVEYLDEG